jgi:hypothetical protein
MKLTNHLRSYSLAILLVGIWEPGVQSPERFPETKVVRSYKVA